MAGLQILDVSDPADPVETGFVVSLGNTIAVLYFENMSSEKEKEYFCADMTEDLIKVLFPFFIPCV